MYKNNVYGIEYIGGIILNKLLPIRVCKNVLTSLIPSFILFLTYCKSTIMAYIIFLLSK